MKNVKSRIEKAREKDGPVPRSVAVSLTVCDIICKSCKFSAIVPCCENNVLSSVITLAKSSKLTLKFSCESLQAFAIA